MLFHRLFSGSRSINYEAGNLKIDARDFTALMVSIIGIVLVLGYLATTAGSHWGTVQTGILGLFALIALAVVCIVFALRS